MNNPRWKTSLLAVARAGSRSPTRSHSPSTAVFAPDVDTARAAGTTLDDIPVFDRHRRQVGAILGAGYATESMDGRAGSRTGENSGDLLSHGMNATINWVTAEPLAAVINQLMNARCLRRIPLMDAQNWLCGIVVFEANEPRSSSVRGTPDTVHIEATPQRR